MQAVDQLGGGGLCSTSLKEFEAVRVETRYL